MASISQIYLLLVQPSWIVKEKRKKNVDSYTYMICFDSVEFQFACVRKPVKSNWLFGKEILFFQLVTR